MLQIPRSVELVIALLGVLRAGASACAWPSEKRHHLHRPGSAGAAGSRALK